MSELAPIGDRGQRYAVHMLTHGGEEMRAGWQDTPEGGLVEMLKKHPNCSEIKIIDRLDEDAEPIIIIPKKKPTRKARAGRRGKRRLGKGRR